MVDLTKAVSGTVSRNPLPDFSNGTNRLDFPASGMTLRDWFAGMALQGIMASGEEWIVEAKEGGWKVEYSCLAYQLADAMMKEQHMDGTASISAERERQKTAEGWTAEHDDTFIDGELVDAAICYARTIARWKAAGDRWPWADEWWKPRSRRENLVRAGALIAAEIDRLDRLKERGK